LASKASGSDTTNSKETMTFQIYNPGPSLHVTGK
jgi:hypothetical protein